MLTNAPDHVLMAEIDQSIRKSPEKAETILSKINWITNTQALEIGIVGFSFEFCTSFL